MAWRGFIPPVVYKAVTLVNGQLGFDLSFHSNGSTSLWDYAVTLTHLKTTGAYSSTTLLASDVMVANACDFTE